MSIAEAITKATMRHLRGVMRSANNPQATLAKARTVPKLKIAADWVWDMETSNRYGFRLNPTLADAIVPMHAVNNMHHIALVRNASLTVQLNSG